MIVEADISRNLVLYINILHLQLHSRDEVVRQLQEEKRQYQEDLLQREKRLQKMEIDLSNAYQETNKVGDEVTNWILFCAIYTLQFGF